MENQREELIQKMENTLRLGGKSEKTILNYSCAIRRFFNFFPKNDISKLNEEDILKYIKKNIWIKIALLILIIWMFVLLNIFIVLILIYL